MEDEIILNIKYGKEFIKFPLSNDIITILNLKNKLIELEIINHSHNIIKIIQKGKILSDETLLSNIDNRSKFQMITSSKESSITATNSINNSQSRIINDLITDGKQKNYLPSQIQSSSSKERYLTTEYRFHDIQVLPNLPFMDKAKEILIELANDPAVLAVMNIHKWKVGLLDELYPEGMVGVDDVCVLGLNTNYGQKISLRIRTDDLLGFRKIWVIKKTLYHELTHNQFGPHDEKFYSMLRQVEKEIKQVDWRNSGQGKIIGDKIERSHHMTNDNHGQVKSIGPQKLGGERMLTSLLPAYVMAGSAAALRKSKEEQEIENSCGCRPIISSSSISSDLQLCEPCIDVNVNISIDDNNLDNSSMIISPVLSNDINNDDIIKYPLLINEVNCINLMSAVDDAIAISLSNDSGSMERMFMYRNSIELMINNHISLIKSNINNIVNNETTSTSISGIDLIDTLKFLRTIVSNAKEFNDEKYRSLSLINKKFQRLIINTTGAIDILQTAGFEIIPNEEKMKLKRYDFALLYLGNALIDTCLTALSQ